MPFSHISSDDFHAVWEIPKGLWGRLTVVQNSVIGLRFIATSFLFFALAGIMALVMRLQLASPENDLIDPNTYNELFTMHGSTMMYLFVIPLIEGIATLVLPQLLGSRELPFPRLTSFAFWTFLFGGLIFYSGFFFEYIVGMDALAQEGWFAYPPLSGIDFSPGRGMDFWLLGLNVAEIAAIAGAFEIILAVLFCRAPGMTLSRIPIFAWAMLVTAFMMLFAFTPLVVGSLLLEVDRKIGTHFYGPDGGGDPLLWQHIFWIFGHPDVYIQFIPPAGILSTIIPVFSRRRLVAYPLVIVALVSTGFLSFGLWVHHMFTTGLPEISLTFFSAVSMVIAIPTAIQVFSWIATMWRGKPQLKPPMLFAMGFFLIFVLGGITGIMLAAVPVNQQVHDTYFVVAHLHYVLFGGMIFPVLAGVYYWAPQYLGRMLNSRLGTINFWLVFIGFNVAFFPMHLAGLNGMPRRYYTYQAGTELEVFNLISTIGAFIIAAGFAVFFFNIFYSYFSTPVTDPNPWGADTLEWGVPKPAPQYGYRKLPIVRSRHTLWDQDDLHKADAKTTQIIEVMAERPYRYRAQLTTGVLDGEPLEIFRVAGPSIFPLLLAFSMTAFSFFLIFDLYVLGGIAIAGSILSLIGWHYEPKTADEYRTEVEDQIEELTGLPVHVDGSPRVARGSMLLTLLTLSIAFVTLIFTYLYLRLNFENFPPPSMSIPDVSLALIGLVLLWISGWGTYMAGRAVQNDALSRLRIFLGASIVVAAIAIGLQLRFYLFLPFDATVNAYASAFYVIAVFILMIQITGTVFMAILLFGVLRHGSRRPAHKHTSVTNLVLFSLWIAGTTTLGSFTLFALPHLL
ncbi:MAG: cytochrome c oxidase subunit I [Aggregatilineales bacterium]